MAERPSGAGERRDSRLAEAEKVGLGGTPSPAPTPLPQAQPKGFMEGLQSALKSFGVKHTFVDGKGDQVMPKAKKPGDLSHLGRTDPLERDASQFPYMRLTRGTVSKAERDEANRNYNESVRREFRQSEDAGGGAALNGARHNFVDGKGTK